MVLNLGTHPLELVLKFQGSREHFEKSQNMKMLFPIFIFYQELLDKRYLLLI